MRVASAAYGRRGLGRAKQLSPPVLEQLALFAFSDNLPHMVRCVGSEPCLSRHESYSGGVCGGLSGETSPCGAALCVLSLTSTSVAPCWPLEASMWTRLGSLAAAAPPRATSKMPSW